MKDIPVLFENDFCMVLNKPAGLPVQGGEGIKTSLDSVLSQKYPSRPLLVHRLDKDTSGLILVAKTAEAAAGFSALFAGTGGRDGKERRFFPARESRPRGEKRAAKQKRPSPGGKEGAGKSRAVIKQYIGLCAGRAESSEGVIGLGLEVRGKVKEAETFFRVLSSGGGKPFSLLELELGTGRMHQIRRHLAQSGLPLLGDDKYGDFPLNRELRKTMGLKYLLLHASRLIIPPSPGLVPGGLDISAPPPDYFLPFIEMLTATPHFP